MEYYLIIGGLVFIFILFFIIIVFYFAKKVDQINNTIQLSKVEQESNIKNEMVNNLLKINETIKDFEINYTQNNGQQVNSLLETVLKSMNEQSMSLTSSLSNSLLEFNKKISSDIQNIDSKVENRLSEGLNKNNEIITNLSGHLKLIDNNQNKLEDLSKNINSLTNILSDKQARGAWGEIQLEKIIENFFAKNQYEKQYKLSNGTKVDFYIKMPKPNLDICLDSKFPLENFRKYVSEENKDLKLQYMKKFKTDLKKHIDDISEKYIISGYTAEYAIMFIPSEAIFAEVHSQHEEIADYSLSKKVVLASPNTITALLTTVAGIIKDQEIIKQVNLLKSNLSIIYKDVERFEIRKKELKQSYEKTEKIMDELEISATKIYKNLKKLEQMESIIEEE